MMMRTAFLDPMAELVKFQRDMNRLLNGYCRPADVFPRVNAWADEGKAEVRAEVPGVDPSAVHLTVTGDVLVIEGDRSGLADGEGVEVHRRERTGGVFRRAIRLPWDIEEGEVKATQRNGVLTVTLPRRASTKPRAIPVAAE
jgi:HSP20 family protein